MLSHHHLIVTSLLKTLKCALNGRNKLVIASYSFFSFFYFAHLLIKIIHFFWSKNNLIEQPKTTFVFHKNDDLWLWSFHIYPSKLGDSRRNDIVQFNPTCIKHLNILAEEKLVNTQRKVRKVTSLSLRLCYSPVILSKC